MTPSCRQHFLIAFMILAGSSACGKKLSTESEDGGMVGATTTEQASADIELEDDFGCALIAPDQVFDGAVAILKVHTFGSPERLIHGETILSPIPQTLAVSTYGKLNKATATVLKGNLSSSCSVEFSTSPRPETPTCKISAPNAADLALGGRITLSFEISGEAHRAFWMDREVNPTATTFTIDRPGVYYAHVIGERGLSSCSLAINDSSRDAASCGVSVSQTEIKAGELISVTMAESRGVTQKVLINGREVPTPGSFSWYPTISQPLVTEIQTPEGSHYCSTDITVKRNQGSPQCYLASSTREVPFGAIESVGVEAILLGPVAELKIDDEPIDLTNPVPTMTLAFDPDRNRERLVTASIAGPLGNSQCQTLIQGYNPNEKRGLITPTPVE